MGKAEEFKTEENVFKRQIGKSARGIFGFTRSVTPVALRAPSVTLLVLYCLWVMHLKNSKKWS